MSRTIRRGAAPARRATSTSRTLLEEFAEPTTMTTSAFCPLVM